VAEVAGQFDIPQNHLVKVVGHLARAGWVQALRGRNGGIRLAAPADTLRIGTVLRELEGDPELVNCEALACRLSADCRLRNALQAGMRAFYEAMNQYSLADLSNGNTGEQIVRMHRTFLASALPAALEVEP
jgi:Rrf2 family nitric oxide-sensitive transcriptional repressor